MLASSSRSRPSATSDMLRASAAQASRERSQLAAGDAAGALAESPRGWLRPGSELEAPYEALRARVLVGRACRALGDDEAFALELESARAPFQQLGAAPDVAAADALATDSEADDARADVARARGAPPRSRAARATARSPSALVISEHTVARHVQNIFAKLGVTSRTAPRALSPSSTTWSEAAPVVRNDHSRAVASWWIRAMRGAAVPPYVRSEPHLDPRRNGHGDTGSNRKAEPQRSRRSRRSRPSSSAAARPGSPSATT